MDIRTDHSILEVSGRQFIINKMSPTMGIAVLKELITRSMPIDLLGMLDQTGGSKSAKLKSLMSFGSIGTSQMGIDEFEEFERRLLSYVYEKLVSGPVCVIDSNGNYRVENLESDTMLVLKLIVEVVKVNYKDFFIEILQEFKVIFKEDDQNLE